MEKRDKGHVSTTAASKLGERGRRHRPLYYLFLYHFRQELNKRKSQSQAELLTAASSQSQPMPLVGRMEDCRLS